MISIKVYDIRKIRKLRNLHKKQIRFQEFMIINKKFINEISKFYKIINSYEYFLYSNKFIKSQIPYK